MSRYDLLVYIGRFQPFHVGHRRVVELALEKTSHLLVLVGSAYQTRTIKNPFTFQERSEMILSSLDPQHISKITIRALRDAPYNENAWLQEVQRQVNMLLESRAHTNATNGILRALSEMKVGIIGYEKDDSSYYLKAFPQWDFIDVGCEYNDAVDATTIREIWLTKKSPRFVEGALHTSVRKFIFEDFPKKEFERLCREQEHITNYKKQWANTPYPVQFNTVDAVVVQSGHILMVKRRSAPGENLWALPGGFINQNETIKQAVFRELKEETKIKVPDSALKGIIERCPRQVFDAPNRSLRGRTITHAFLIELPPGELPKVRGSDDAAKARWIPLSQFDKMEDQCFEDHHYIVSYFIGTG